MARQLPPSLRPTLLPPKLGTLTLMLQFPLALCILAATTPVGTMVSTAPLAPC